MNGKKSKYRAHLLRGALVSLIASGIWAAPILAQGLEVGDLSQAQAFEPGALNSGSGALSSGLWTGTGAQTAEQLINDLPEIYKHPVARNLARRVLLSPGVPPSGNDDQSFPVTRMNGIIRLSELAAAQDIADRSPGLASSEILKADLSLLAGDMETACKKSDSIIEGRSEPYWMKLRALCHIERGETAAADVTLDLLRNGGKTNPYFERLLRHMTGIPGAPDLSGMPATPLHIAMMGQAGLEWPAGQEPAIAAAQTVFNASTSRDARLKALMSAASALSDTQIKNVLDGFAPDSPIGAGLAGGVGGVSAEPSLDSALADKTANGFYQLFQIAQSGPFEARQAATIALLSRAEQGGGFDRFVTFLGPQIQLIDPSTLLASDLPIYARAAILRGDLGALQQTYRALESNPPAQERIALAADALGNGFFGGNLGTDIDTRLAKPGKKARALRDALLAYALGATLSDAALEALTEKAHMGRMTGALFAFDAASAKRAEAETALRAASILESGAGSVVSDFTLHKVVRGLYQAGLTDEAARLAALDFIQDLPE